MKKVLQRVQRSGREIDATPTSLDNEIAQIIEQACDVKNNNTSKAKNQTISNAVTKIKQLFETKSTHNDKFSKVTQQIDSHGSMLSQCLDDFIKYQEQLLDKYKNKAFEFKNQNLSTD
jgi:hypothetical protein